MATEKSKGGAKPRSWQRAWQKCGSWLLRCWWRTLRFRLDDSVQALRKDPPPPLVVLLWHNRLFAAPELYRRFFGGRRLAALVSASGDGDWLTGFLEQLGIRPARGSSHKRGASALRDCLEALQDGCDVAITPDGSRGPVYQMKPGAAALAVKTGAPVYLLSMDYGCAQRLGSWDRFFLPLPFSPVRVALERVELSASTAEHALAEAQRELQARMVASARDPRLCREEDGATSGRPVN